MYSRLEQKIIEKSYHLIDLPKSRFKHFSFLIRKNSQILGVWWNSSIKTHPQSKKWLYRYETIHSEVQLILSAKSYQEDFHRLKVYNVRINNLGEVARSAPCINCGPVLKLFGFREIYYTDYDGKFHQWS